MGRTGHFDERRAPNGAPVFITMAHQEGSKSSQENKAGRKTTGKAEGPTVKGKVRHWSRVGGPGIAAGGNKHLLHFTMERYGKGVKGYSLLKRRRGKRKTGGYRMGL